MRKVENSQMEFGEIAIGEIHIKAKSRDDIPAVLKGIQHIYTIRKCISVIFALLTNRLSGHQSEDEASWHGFMASIVLAVLKLGFRVRDYAVCRSLRISEGPIRIIPEPYQKPLFRRCVM